MHKEHRRTTKKIIGFLYRISPKGFRLSSYTRDICLKDYRFHPLAILYDALDGEYGLQRNKVISLTLKSRG